MYPAMTAGSKTTAHRKEPKRKNSPMIGLTSFLPIVIFASFEYDGRVSLSVTVLAMRSAQQRRCELAPRCLFIVAAGEDGRMRPVKPGVSILMLSTDLLCAEMKALNA
mmetsp:Transcript_21880/g.44481  ORF Transcript_21880/g.44481 Transcript_21880/m.44481 type:complete len:108 (-) Transcript_21880:82-405(-)